MTDRHGISNGFGLDGGAVGAAQVPLVSGRDPGRSPSYRRPLSQPIVGPEGDYLSCDGRNSKNGSQKADGAVV